jgi:hypothetical protein
MDRLRSQYLNVQTDTVLHPASAAAELAVQEDQAVVASLPRASAAELKEAVVDQRYVFVVKVPYQDEPEKVVVSSFFRTFQQH